MRVEMNLDVQHCHDDIDTKIAEFKQDANKMNELNLFLDSVLEEAQRNAEVKLQSKLVTFDIALSVFDLTNDDVFFFSFTLIQDEERPKNGE